jgi:hypothetical protein
MAANFMQTPSGIQQGVQESIFSDYLNYPVN